MLRNSYKLALSRAMLASRNTRGQTRDISGTASRFWSWTTQSRPHWKESKVEAAVLFCVFGITGSTSVALVRPSLKSAFGIEGTLIDGPNSYRVLSVLLVSPIYAVVLLTVGTLAGRHNYFARMATKIFGRFLPKSVGPKIKCPPAKAADNMHNQPPKP